MIKAILMDIEGTTSSLSFVRDVLFPYSRERMADFIGSHLNDVEVRKLLDDARAVAGQQLNNEQLIQQLLRWVDEDRKVTPLKSLQGLIWGQGYQKGDFHGHIYEDAARKLKEWWSKGIKLYVFSSGSVYAQKLLFGHTKYGDLTPLFSGYFDTSIGAKQDVDSYRKIIGHIGLAPGEILFLSDIKAELDAARSAGMKTIWLVREGEIVFDGEHLQVRNFDATTFNLYLG